MTWVERICLCVVVLLLFLVGVVGIEEGNEWDRFKQAHNCVVVGKMDGEVFNTFGVGANGQVSVGVGTTRGKTGWRCDDGITYWK